MDEIIKCAGCKHADVCKHRDNFKDLYKEMRELFEKIDRFPFDLEINCKYFSKPDMPYWPEGVRKLKEQKELTNVPKDFDDFKWPNTIKINEGWADLDCENCPSNPKYNPLGIQVGDTPCTFCPKMQPKVTYDND